MKRLLVIILLMALMLSCAARAELDEKDWNEYDPEFLSAYAEYYVADDWYVVCLDGDKDEGDALNDSDTHWALLDGEGNVLQQGLRRTTGGNPDYASVFPFTGFMADEKLAPIRIEAKWGYIDRAGEMRIPPQYDYAKFFQTGNAPAYVEGSGWGLIDESGAWVVEPAYTDIHHAYGDGDWWWLCKDGLYGLADGRRGVLTECAYDDYNDAGGEPPFVVSRDLLKGYVDSDGREIVPPIYDFAEPFQDGLAAVYTGGKWGFIDRTGAWVLPPTFADIDGFNQGLAAAKDPDSGKYGYIDTSGAWAIEPQFISAFGFVPAGYAVVWLNNDTRAVIDRSGRVLMKHGNDDGEMFLSGDGIVTIIDDDGDGPDFYDLSSGEAKPAKILTASMDLTDYMPFTGKKVAKLDGKPTLAHRVSKEERLPHLDGATALFPVYSAFVQALYPSKTRYEAYDGENNPLVTCTKTNVAYERLINGEADIIFVAQPSDEELQMAADKGVEFDMLPFGREAFVFVVNQRNPCEGLMLNEIRWIYSGVVKDWDEVGVEGLGPIIPYQRPKNSGSQTALEALMDGMPLMDAPQEIVANDMGDILETVEYRNLPNALGYTFRFFCTDMMKSDVKLLAIDDVAPTVENIRNGSYPLTSTLYAIRLKGNTNPNVEALWQWLQEDQAAELIEKTGYVAGTGAD